MFQFTQPKRLRRLWCTRKAGTWRFNSRSPSGLRLGSIIDHKVTKGFQFTQPKRAATSSGKIILCSVSFQFTQPKRAATWGRCLWLRWQRCFNSRSPRGLRQWLIVGSLSRLVFQFTQPKRAATRLDQERKTLQYVSIHAAQAGCDGVERLLTHSWSVFQFTQPKRAATVGTR